MKSVSVNSRTQRILEDYEAYTFNDITLSDLPSEYTPDQIKLETWVTKNIKIKGCIISAAMDTVTEAYLAQEMARNGSLGVIHRNTTPEEQAEMVRIVKQTGKFDCRIHPVIFYGDDKLAFLQQEIKKKNYKFTSFPILNRETDVLIGLITSDELDFAEEGNPELKEIMKSLNKLVISNEKIDNNEAIMIMKKHMIKKLPLLNNEGGLAGMYVWTDLKRHLEKNECYSVDKQGRLLVGAAIGFGEDDMYRADLLIKAGCDIIVLDSSHGACLEGKKQLTRLREKYGDDIDIIIGNVASYESAAYLLEGPYLPDAIKVGIGPGSICTTRKVTGCGVPQLTAIYETWCATRDLYLKENIKIPIIADGGISCSGDIVKCFAVGASCCMNGSMFAATYESPGDIITHNGIEHKTYRGMGSKEAMESRYGSRKRYLMENEKSDQLTSKQQQKIVPEGVQGFVPIKGTVEMVLTQLNGGVKGGLAHSGSLNIEKFREKVKIYKQTQAGVIEGNPHGLKF